MQWRKAEGPPTVQVPSAAQDRPPWRRIGILAAAGFAVGLVWPHLVGLRRNPGAPESPSPSPAAASSPAPQASPPDVPATVASAAPAALPAPLPVVPPPAAPSSGPGGGPVPSTESVPTPVVDASARGPVEVAVASGVILSCKTPDGDSLKPADCGKLIALDGVIRPRLKRLAECPEAGEANGRVQFTLHLDFAHGGVTADLGRTQGVSSTDGLLACARTDLLGAALASVAHDRPRYNVSYAVLFGSAAHAPPPAPEAPAATPERPSRPVVAAGEESALVVWEVALVRDAPKTGKIVARLQRGSAVHVGPVKDGWYPVKSADGFAGGGWVFKGAIGR